MIIRAGKRGHRPQHAHPSLLAPGRSAAGVGVMALLAGLGIGLLAALAGGPDGAAAGAAVPRAINTPQAGAVAAVAGGTTAQLQSSGVSLPVLASSMPPSSSVTSGDTSSSIAAQPDSAPVSALAASGIPVTALTAYKEAAAREAKLNPACGLTWPLLAGIGRVESDHGRFAGAVLHSDGLSTPPVIGIPLNGHGTALILDTDGGRLDGDTVYDNAVGPMQFIPSTWAGWGVDANGDGVKDPFNIFDAAAAAADYLCAAGRDLTTSHGQVQAILSYNYSYDYVRLVMSLEQVYAHGVGIDVPILPTSPEPTKGPPKHKPKLPPVDPGKPPGASSSSPRPTPSPSPSSSTSTTPKPSPTYSRSAPIPPPSATASPTPKSSTPSPSPSSSETSSGSSSPSGATSSTSGGTSDAGSAPASP